jgi:hypothetical protein
MIDQDNGIARKIRALQALADRAGTEAEAALAADRVAELLRKHNLEIGSVQLEAEEKTATEGVSYHMPGKVQAHWTNLALACCSMFGVGKYRRNVGGRVERVFYGLKANVAAATMTYDYLVASVEALLDGAKKTHGLYGASEFRSYKIGASQRIYDEARKLKAGRELHDVSPESMALTKLENSLIAAHKKAAGLKTLKPAAGAAHRSLYDLGYAAGGRVDIHGARRSRMIEG